MQKEKFEIDPIIEEYGQYADEVKPETALHILSKIYIDNCGVSIGTRTVAEESAFIWIVRWKSADPTAPQDISTLHQFMELKSDYYKKNREWIDKYDIMYLEPEDFQRISVEMMNETDDRATKIALAAGAYYSLQRSLDIIDELQFD